jgi:hypothetical protein
MGRHPKPFTVPFTVADLDDAKTLSRLATHALVTATAGPSFAWPYTKSNSSWIAAKSSGP